MTLYLIAGFFFGWLLPEFIKMLAPRNYNVPFMMNFMAGTVVTAVVHYILTH